MVQAYLLRIYLFEGTIPSFCLRLELSFTSQNLVVQSAPTYTIVSSLGAVASTTSLLGSRSPRWRTLLLLPRAPPSRTRCLCPPCPRTHILPNTQSAAPLFVGCRCCPAPYNGKRSLGPLPACPGCRNKSHPASTTNNQRTQMARSSKSTKTPREPDASVYYCTEPWQRMVTRYAAKAQLHL